MTSPLSFFPPFSLCFFALKLFYVLLRNLDVYRKAYAANQKVYRTLKDNKGIPRYANDQLGRASLSIMLNIAEGSAKFSNKDRKNFYVTARGSTFECSALVTFLHDEMEISNELFEELSLLYEEISRMLYTMIKHLEEKEVNGK